MGSMVIKSNTLKILKLGDSKSLSRLVIESTSLEELDISSCRNLVMEEAVVKAPACKLLDIHSNSFSQGKRF
jgi:hypothetical protein